MGDEAKARSEERTVSTGEADPIVDPETPDVDSEWIPAVERFRRFVHRIGARIDDDPGRIAEIAFTVVAVVVATWVVVSTLDPRLILRDTTPTGGDMGAHVWGPDYLKREVLPRFGLTWWTHDWFNGFPAYQFYMVIPSLLVVILSVGLVAGAAIALVLLAGAAVVGAWTHPRLHRFRRPILIAAVALTVLAVPISYNRAFKIVTVLGLVFLPLASWAMARLADLPFPIPPLAAVASLIFLFNREPFYLAHGNIIGGNFNSTLAGEFAFSISLTIAVLYLGVAARGLRTGRHRGLAAVLFALAGLCHLIPAFFVLACTIALFLLHPDRARFRWLATMTPVAGLLSAFWVVPFWWRRDYVNDMGWERLPEVNAGMSEAGRAMAGDPSSVWYYLFPTSGLRWVMIAALVGVAISIVRRYRIGLVLALAWAGVAAAFVVLPQYRLWNARLLPFQYLVVALLAAIGVGELVRVAGIIASGRVDRPFRFITVLTAALFAAGALVSVILPVNGLFEKRGTNFGFERVDVPVTRVGEDGQPTVVQERQARFKLFGRIVHASTPEWSGITGWARWNYTGLEDPDSKAPVCGSETWGADCVGGWHEFEGLIATMQAIGDDPDHGCGRMFWEYEKDRVNSYGTTMAPMLLPYFTDGCIGSQEGLYFESTPSVPIHFIVQSELSTRPSRPQRFMSWPDFDIDRGVRHLQMLGVSYYGAITPEAIDAAETHPDLELIARTPGPDQQPAWHVYAVADAPDVSPLRYEPAVAENLGESQDDWLPTASSWFQQGDLEVPFTLDGPESWQRVRVDPVRTDLRRLTDWLLVQVGHHRFLDELPEVERRPLPEIEVTNIDRTADRISFDVSEPGVPVLVKTSYFPNWTVSGAKGVYRATPNLMVVVPTETHVELRYRRSPIDLLAHAMTLAGLVALWGLARQRPIEVSELGSGRVSERLDALLSLERPAETGRTGADPPDPLPDASGSGVESENVFTDHGEDPVDGDAVGEPGPTITPEESADETGTEPGDTP